MADQMVSEYRLVDGTNPRLRFSTQNTQLSSAEEVMQRAIKEEFGGEQSGLVSSDFD